MNVKLVVGLIAALVIVGLIIIKNEIKKPSAAKAALSNAEEINPVVNMPNSKTVVSQAARPDEKIYKNIACIIDHTCIKLDRIPVKWIVKARKDLHIAYGHTSHGSQIISGLLGLGINKGSPYLYNSNLPTGYLDLRDNPFGNGGPIDLGQPSNKSWAEETRSYLKKNKDINVVMWSWCGQLSSANDRDVKIYLDLMQGLEADFPEVVFIYMTGHLDGSGENGKLAKNNNSIRKFCISNNKVLYDFADIESYNPDGVYFGDKNANDACDYFNGKNDARNWAVDWQNAHIKGYDWYECPAAHSQPVNANMKAYAAWWLMARLAGWDGITFD